MIWVKYELGTTLRGKLRQDWPFHEEKLGQD